MSRYLIDNSVLQRLSRNTEVQAAVAAILNGDDELCCCALTLDEFAFSARSSIDTLGFTPTSHHLPLPSGVAADRPDRHRYPKCTLASRQRACAELSMSPSPQRRCRPAPPFCTTTVSLTTFQKCSLNLACNLGRAKGHDRLMAINGLWRIVEMDLWDQDAIDLVGPAFIDFGPRGLGSFRFIVVEAEIDYRRSERNGRGSNRHDQLGKIDFEGQHP